MIAASAFGPITSEQQERMDASAARTAERRRLAAYTPLVKPEEIEEAKQAGTATNCARCTHLGNFNAEHQRGYCCWLRHMVGTRNPSRCSAFQAPA